MINEIKKIEVELILYNFNINFKRAEEINKIVTLKYKIIILSL